MHPFGREAERRPLLRSEAFTSGTVTVAVNPWREFSAPLRPFGDYCRRPADSCIDQPGISVHLLNDRLVPQRQRAARLRKH